MKFKYFLRGMGIGFLFCSLIYIAAYQTSPNKLLTDEDVIARAKELGMVEAPTQIEELLEGNSTEEQTAEEKTTEEQTAEEKTTEEKTTEEQTAEEKTTEEKTTEEQTTEEKTTEEKTTEEKTTEETSAEEKEVVATITIKRGMQSITVAKLMEKEGIIKDAYDFDKYLNKKGYSTKLRVGTYTMKNTYTYEKLAKIIMGK